jgi:MoaA/NifB/PqqE/SkfB family radical SAM enzyme
MQNSRVGISKILVYLRIGANVLFKYRKHLSIKFLYSAATLLLAFYHNKLIKLNNVYKLHLYLPAYPTRAFFKAVEDKLLSNPPKPVTIVYSTTKACTYKCQHCYQKLDKGVDLPLDLIKKTIQAISDAGVCFLNIEGGDAFLRFNELCAILDTVDDTVEIWVNTTGANVSREKLLILKEKGLCGLMVSIHSPSAEEHDKFVGVEGAFELAKQTLRICDEIDLGSAINTVLEYEKIQKNKLPEIMDLAKELKCGFVQLIHPKRAGMWLKNDALNKEDEAIKKYVEKVHKYYNGFRTTDYPALPAQAEEEHTEKFGCTSGGIDRFYIGASGEVQPCEFLNISFGNVKDEDFEIIFRRMREYFKTPCEDWLCATQSGAIYELMAKHNLEKLPIPYEYTKELVESWDRGKPTNLYKKMGLYQDE